jgi:hypothetical protein
MAKDIDKARHMQDTHEIKDKKKWQRTKSKTRQGKTQMMKDKDESKTKDKRQSQRRGKAITRQRTKDKDDGGEAGGCFSFVTTTFVRLHLQPLPCIRFGDSTDNLHGKNKYAKINTSDICDS